MREYLKPRQLRVPVCGDCAAGVRRARRTRALAYGVVAAAMTATALTTTVWLAALLGAAIAIVWAALEWLTKPWPVAAKANEDTIAYAFTRRDMARKFAFVNRVVLD